MKLSATSQILILLILASLASLKSVVDTHTPTKIFSLCPTSETSKEVRSNPDLVTSEFESCLIQLRSEFSGFTDDELYAIFVMRLVNQFAPYGANEAVTLDQYYSSRYLTCDGYAKLMIDLLSKRPTNLKIFYTVWEGGLFSAHVEVSACNKEKCLLLDPTISMVAEANVLQIANGQLIDGRKIFHFEAVPGTEYYQKAVMTALMYGRIRPNDLRAYIQVFP